MATSTFAFEAFELTPRTSSAVVAAAARTICHAFSNDPLIQWLRPNATPWGSLAPGVLTWQTRRIYDNMVCGRVFGIRNVSGTAVCDGNARLPAVAFVSGPITWTHWLSRLPTRLWLWLQRTFVRGETDGADEQRVVRMITGHDETMSSLQHKFKEPTSCIEVVAVDPDRQGHGLGTLLLRHVLSTVGTTSTVILESTREASLTFYEKQGFAVERETFLSAETDSNASSVKLWVMVREPDKSM